MVIPMGIPLLLPSWSLMGLARDEDVLAVAQLDEVEDYIKLEKLLSNILMGSN